jgi:hypothetical protein
VTSCRIMSKKNKMKKSKKSRFNEQNKLFF